MPDLIIYLPNHGYSDDTDKVYVSWLDANYFVSDKDANSFKLATISGGSELVQYSEDITDGFVRKITESGVTSITGLEHLQGEVVKVTSNGSVVTTATVASGSITTPEVFTYAVGKAYTATLVPMDIDIEGTGLATTKRPNKVIVNMNESIGGKIGQVDTNLVDISDETALFTGHKEVSLPGGYSRDTDVVIKQTEPLPMTVLSLTYDLGASRD
jgi:hypothetical protein